MINPFEKRATEFLRDDTAFLSVVTPEPLQTFFEEGAKNGTIFDRLCMVIGTPGSGKTTIARLLQFQTINTLLNSRNHTDYKALHSALSVCEMINDETPLIIGCRIPMESEYRDIWELPYTEELRFGLLASILQSRAVIAWIRSIEQTEDYDLSKSTIKYRDGAQAAADSVGGFNLDGVLEKARYIEQLIYDVTAGLIPPSEENLPTDSTAPYHPFDAIEKINLKKTDKGELVSLKPLVILDDVHSLHPKQLVLMREWLSKRETKISRWMLMRLDAQTPELVLDQGFTKSRPSNNSSTINQSREISQIWLQGSSDRGVKRKKFKVMAKNMADKYLRQMPTFQREGLQKIQDILGNVPGGLTNAQLKELVKKVDIVQRKAGIGDSTRIELEAEVSRYCLVAHSPDISEEISLAMLRILMHRYIIRVPQKSIFDDKDEQLIEPKRQLKADSGVADGARLQLHHEFNRAYYYGIDAVANGSSENAEQFLHLAGRLVSTSEARIIRKKPALLPADHQHKLLKDKSNQIIQEWEYPRHHEVIQLCTYIAKECLQKTLEPNASLGGGANAFGILQKSFDKIVVDHKDLAQILKYAIAYSSLSLKSNYKVKDQYWTLIELTGPFIIRTGLTFTRGGFLERSVDSLLAALEN